MAVGRVESERFPYVPITVRIGDHMLGSARLVDTGFDGDIVLPADTVFLQDPDIYSRWAFADGSVVDAPVHYVLVRVGAFDPVLLTVALIGEEVIIGRGVLDRYRVIFDHGQRVVVEP